MVRKLKKRAAGHRIREIRSTPDQPIRSMKQVGLRVQAGQQVNAA